MISNGVACFCEFLAWVIYAGVMNSGKQPGDNSKFIGGFGLIVSGPSVASFVLILLTVWALVACDHCNAHPFSCFCVALPSPTASFPPFRCRYMCSSSLLPRVMLATSSSLFELVCVCARAHSLAAVWLFTLIVVVILFLKKKEVDDAPLPADNTIVTAFPTPANMQTNPAASLSSPPPPPFPTTLYAASIAPPTPEYGQSYPSAPYPAPAYVPTYTDSPGGEGGQPTV